MKKLLFFLLLTIPFSSCIKSWTCHCEITNYTVVDSTAHPLTNSYTTTSIGNKKDLKKQCDEYKNTLMTTPIKGYTINNVECNLK